LVLAVGVWAVASPENEDASQLVCMRLFTVQTKKAFCSINTEFIWNSDQNNDFKNLDF